MVEVSQILAEAEEWKRLARVIGCEAQGFDNANYAAFYSPDGNVWNIGPKTKEFLTSLEKVKEERDRLREALESVVCQAEYREPDLTDDWHSGYVAGLDDGARIARAALTTKEGE